MARKSAVEEEEVVDYTGYVDKEPTALQEAFAEWLVDQVGVKFANKQAEKAFDEGVRLATTLRMQFQASPEWRSDERNSRYSGGERVAKSAANGTEKPARRGRAAKAQTEPEPGNETEDEAPVKAPARRGRPPGKAPKAPAPKRSGRRGAPASTAEAPY